MGYQLSRYDDVRLNGSPWNIEKRSESVVFWLQDDDNDTQAARFEVTYKELDELETCITVVQDYISGQSRPPNASTEMMWRQEDRDRDIMEKYADLDVEELKRYLQLQEHMARHDVHELERMLTS